MDVLIRLTHRLSVHKYLEINNESSFLIRYSQEEGRRGGFDSFSWKVFCFQIRWNCNVGPKSSPAHSHGHAPTGTHPRARTHVSPGAGAAPTTPPAARECYHSPPSLGRSFHTTPFLFGVYCVFRIFFFCFFLI